MSGGPDSIHNRIMVPVRALQRFARLGIALTVMALWLPLWSHGLHHRQGAATALAAADDLCLGSGEDRSADAQADVRTHGPTSSHDGLNLQAQACELSCASLAAATLPAAAPASIGATFATAAPRIPAGVPARTVGAAVRPLGQGPPQA